jgi:hypothetical protein
MRLVLSSIINDRILAILVHAVSPLRFRYRFPVGSLLWL